jgi:hypothetical protein
VDTQESIETRFSIVFPACSPQLNRTLLITHLQYDVRCTGHVAEKFKAEREQRVSLEIAAANEYGETKIAGEAVVAL